MANDIYKVSANQRKELQRLTQFANRRIKAFTKEYEKAGMTILPREVSGGIQTRQQWANDKTPLSRSTKFADKKAFDAHMRWLKSFEHSRPNVTDYEQIQRVKVLQGVGTAVGQYNISVKLEDKLANLSVAELKKFWDLYSEYSKRIGLLYSSDAVMSITMMEFFDDDLDHSLDQYLQSDIDI